MKKNVFCRAVYFGLNALAMLPALISAFSLISAGVYLAVEALLGYLFIRRGGENAPAAEDLPLLLFFDVPLYAGLHYELLISRFTSEFPLNVNRIVLFLIFAAAFGIAGLKLKKRVLKWISVLLLGLGGFASMRMSALFQLVLYAAFVCMWMAVSIISERLNPNKAARNNWLGAILTVFFTAAVLCEGEAVFYLGGEWRAVLSFAGGLLSTPWKALLFTVGIALCALLMCSFDPWEAGIDARLLLTFASLAALSAFAGRRFFVYSLPVVGAAVVLSITALAGFASGKSRRWYFPVLLALSCMLALTLLYDGLWLTLLAIAVSAAIFRRLSRKNEFYKESSSFWMLIPICGFAVSLSWLCFKRLSTPGILVLILITAVTLAALWVLGRPHPAGIWAGNRYRVAICAAFAVLCAATLCRGGFSADTQYTDYKVSVEVGCRDGDAVLDSISYTWTDAFGLDESAEHLYLNRERTSSANLSWQNTRLVIRATDSLGVSTRIVVWRPFPLDEYLYSWL